MRLAIIRQQYAPAGTAFRLFESALEALLERNVAISLYTREWPQTRLQLIEPVICNPWHAGAFSREWGFARAVCRVIGDAKANLVESHERVLCCDVYRAQDGVHAVWLEERRRGASAWDRLRLALSPYNRYMMLAERRLYASPWLQAVICGSTMVRDEIRDRFGVPEAKIKVIPNAVDTDFFNPQLRGGRDAFLVRQGIDAAATVFLLAGSGYEHSGAGTAIEALAELPPPAQLVIAGRRRHAARYRFLARKFGVAGRVTITESEADPRACYGAADAFVLPTLYDPTPESTLEAMACGLPVVTSTKSGAAELLLRHDGGLVCPAGDVAGLSAQMRALLDPATRARLGANARAAVLPLTPAAITLQLVLLYRDLLAATVAKKRPEREAEAAPTPPPQGAPVADDVAAAEAAAGAGAAPLPAAESRQVPSSDAAEPPPAG